MAYSSTNPPSLLVGRVGDDNPSLWVYQSTHTVGEAAASGFIANGDDLGMLKGDAVLVHQSTAGIATWMFVSSVTASSAATLTAVTTST